MAGENNGKESKQGTELVAHLHKDQLRSLFYLFSGKPDSQIKVFSTPVHLQKNDILELHDCISRKLAIHSIDAIIATVNVSFEGSKICEFGSWAEFLTHHWQEPDRIEEFVVKWDFLVSIDGFKTPQRHTVLFRVSRDIKPGKIIQMIAAGNSDEYDNVDMISSAAFCRVDFINSQLSKELINVISDWYTSRKSPKLIPNVWYWFKKKKQGVAEIFDHWMLLSWSLLVASLIIYLGRKYTITLATLPTFAAGMFLAIYSLRPMSVVSRRMAARAYQALSSLEGNRVVFEFTSGDKKRITEVESENKEQGMAFVWASVWNIALNIIATFLYTMLFTHAV